MTTQEAKSITDSISTEIAKSFIGSREIVNNTILALCAGLPILIEDIPGVGKTTLARSLAQACGLDFGRIQFTPDLIPGDILGMSIWDPQLKDFVLKPGSIMHQFILADELNRASARTQAALLESMQEQAVTIDGKTTPLPEPFFLIATQNPSSFAGTFQLPEAQIDRFGIRISIGYPEPADEAAIIRQVNNPDFQPGSTVITAVTTASQIIELRRYCANITIDSKIIDYIIRIAAETRRSTMLRGGLSPRSSQHLARAAQAIALLEGRSFVLPEDVMKAAPLIAGHRLVPTAETRLSGMTALDVLSQIFKRIAQPTGI